MSETTRRTKRTQSAASEDVRKEEGMTTATKSVAAKSAKGRRGRAAQKHLVYRARHTYINSTEELGALVRIFRLRTGMTQTEAAKACGVGRRWFNELENGKDTIRVGMVINVLRHFGATLTIGGAGARFTVEELAVRLEAAVVGIEAVFKNEAHLQAVAEVFRALEAEAGAGVVAARHFERINGVLVGLVAVNVGVTEAEVGTAVERHVGGKGGAGKGAEDCKSCKGLFHF